MNTYQTVRTLLLLVITVTGVAANADPVEWPLSQGGNGHFYELVDEPLTWFEARDAAELRSWMELPGHLVTMSSFEEDHWCWLVFGVLDHGYWLGGYQPEGTPEPDEGCRWVTGESWGYTGWGDAEPNDFYEEDCLSGWFVNFRGWNDVSCDEIKPWGYIVEYESEIVDVNRNSWGVLKSLYR